MLHSALASGPVDFLHNTTGDHNSTIIFGYMHNHWQFQHADNSDLIHLAVATVSCVFFPVRHDSEQSNHLDQAIYHLNEHYGAQTPCLIECMAGEIIRYDWFRNTQQLNALILFDLPPHLKNMRPDIEKPTLRFALDRQRRLVAGDCRRGVHVRITPNSVWALNVFSPAGSPPDTSEIILGLKPYDRATGNETAWPDHRTRKRDLPVSGAGSGKHKAARPEDPAAWEVVARITCCSRPLRQAIPCLRGTPSWRRRQC